MNTKSSDLFSMYSLPINSFITTALFSGKSITILIIMSSLTLKP